MGSSGSADTKSPGVRTVSASPPGADSVNAGQAAPVRAAVTVTVVYRIVKLPPTASRRPHLGAHPRPGHRHPTPCLPTTRRRHPTDPPVARTTTTENHENPAQLRFHPTSRP